MVRMEGNTQPTSYFRGPSVVTVTSLIHRNSGTLERPVHLGPFAPQHRRLDLKIVDFGSGNIEKHLAEVGVAWAEPFATSWPGGWESPRFSRGGTSRVRHCAGV